MCYVYMCILLKIEYLQASVLVIWDIAEFHFIY